MNSALSLILLGENRLLSPDIGERLELPGSILFALFLGTVISLLAVFIIMIGKQLKLDGGQYLLWSLAGAILLAPIIYFVFLSKPAGYAVLDFLRLSDQSRL
jgi:hypothetical protein